MELLKAFSNSLETLVDGSNDGQGPKISGRTFTKIRPMMPTKAVNLMISVDQVLRQKKSDVPVLMFET